MCSEQNSGCSVILEPLSALSSAGPRASVALERSFHFCSHGFPLKSLGTQGRIVLSLSSGKSPRKPLLAPGHPASEGSPRLRTHLSLFPAAVVVFFIFIIRFSIHKSSLSFIVLSTVRINIFPHSRVPETPVCPMGRADIQQLHTSPSGPVVHSWSLL